MLIPNKYSRPDETLLACATLLLKALRKSRVIDYAALREQLIKAHPAREALFIPSVDLLYLLDLLVYRPASDSFEYVGS